MREQNRAGSLRGRLMRGGLVVGGLAAAVAVTEIRHRRGVRRDPQYEELRYPLVGMPLSAVSADGTLIHAEVFGPVGAPAFVLVPGWTERLQIFDLVTRRLLARGFRVVAYDLRGQGESGPPVDGDQRIERYGEDLEAVLAAIAEQGGRDEVVVAGHSMGGMSIMAWAQAYDAASRVKAAALMNTGAANLIDSSTLLPHSIPEPIRHELGRRVILEGAPPPPLSTPLSRAALRYVAFGPAATDAHVDFMERMGWSCPAAVRIGGGRTLAGLNVLAGAARLNVPTLVLTGDLDRMTPPALAVELAATVPQLAEQVLMSRTGHMALLERPDEVVDALVRLASGVGVRVRG